MKKFLIGVDVGTSSVRAGLFSDQAELVSIKLAPITVFNPRADFYEQSSDEIWSAVCDCVKQLAENPLARPPHGQIVSIGFDATCSLVTLDHQFRPVGVNADDSNDIIMWMDHRAKPQAEFINALDNLACLKTVGGKISPEMDPPKLLWLKQNLPESFRRTAHFFSLPDFLVWRATGVDVRSVCSTTCKWLLKSGPDEMAWDTEFWSRIGLEELTRDGFSRIGARVERPLRTCGDLIVSQEFARSTGLGQSVRVGVSLIDAHAGGIGALSIALSGSHSSLDMSDVLVVVSGTSSCFMASSREPHFVPGVWGPYYDAMAPGMWLNEAGQSAAGKLVDHLIETHPAASRVRELASQAGCSVYEALDRVLERLRVEKKLENVAYLAKTLHVYPDLHGNRSPLADPDMSGSICGLTFDTGVDGVAVLYLSTVQALAYQSRQIIEKMKEHAVEPKMMVIIGGLAQNGLYCRTMCDVCSMPVVVPASPETSVLLGSAIAGASNCAEFGEQSFNEIIHKFMRASICSDDCFLEPNESVKKFHKKKYEVYKLMLKDQLKYIEIMQN